MPEYLQKVVTKTSEIRARKVGGAQTQLYPLNNLSHLVQGFVDITFPLMCNSNHSFDKYLSTYYVPRPCTVINLAEVFMEVQRGPPNRLRDAQQVMLS
jgi:hypothetical protein